MIEGVCHPNIVDPYAQRYHFWMRYAEEHRMSSVHDEKDANVKYYGGVEELCAVLRKDFFPILRPLRMGGPFLAVAIVEEA